MIIYTPYTYLIGWSKHQKFYYGRRTSKSCHPSELWKSYFTSSRHVKEFRKKFGDPDIIQIRRAFNTPRKARIWEDKVLRRLDAAKNPKFLNKRNGDSSDKFNTAGTANAKTSSGEYLGAISLTDPRWQSGEIVGANAGIRFPYKSRDSTKGTCTFLDIKDGSYKRAHVSDPRVISGELIHASKGKKLGKQTKEHVAKRVTNCKPRSEEVNVRLAKQWSDLRKGKAAAKDFDGNSLGLIDLMDPRWGIEIFKSRHYSSSSTNSSTSKSDLPSSAQSCIRLWYWISACINP